MTEQNTNQLPPSAPPQGQMYFPPQYYAPEDEIDLRELFGVLWKGKWWIIGITAIFAVASVFYVMSLPNVYKATAIVAPAGEQSGGGLSQMAGQLGGLASLAGVSLGTSETTDTIIAMESMKTWGFIDEFIEKHDLQVSIVAAKGWDRNNNKLIIADEMYDIAQEKWVRKASRGKSAEPSSWELYKEFKKNLSIGQDTDTGLINVGFRHLSPVEAQKITQWLIEDINALMKKRALDDATKNINYLQKQITQTPLSDMQNVFYSLIEEQTKTKMLANVSDEYVFKYISIPRVPEEKEGPRRAIICAVITAFGGLLSVLIILMRKIIYSDRLKENE